MTNEPQNPIPDIAAALDVQPEQIVKWRETEDGYTVLVDKGIKGTQKIPITRRAIAAHQRAMRAIEAATDADEGKTEPVASAAGDEILPAEMKGRKRK